MKRSDALAHLRIAGYHGDHKAFMRLYVENRVAYPIAQRAFADGAAMYRNGVKCSCMGCEETERTRRQQNGS